MEMDGQRLLRRSVARRRQVGPAAFYNQVYDDGTVLVVTPTGDLDMATVPAIEAVVRRCTDRYRVLIVDLSRATFLDSQIVRLLLELREGPCGDRLTLVPPPDEVGQVLDHTGVRPLFHWATSSADEMRTVLARDR
jgi:anti-anti-sigma factor